MKDIVAVNAEWTTNTHIGDINGNYSTLCGLDGDDPNKQVRQITLKVKCKKITCRTCFDIWKKCKKFKKSDFEVME